MKQENFEKLKMHEIHWHTLRDAGFVKNLGMEIVSELEKVYQDELDKNFHVNRWCNSCVSEMIRILYIATKYDQYEQEIINNKNDIIINDDGVAVNANGEIVKVTKKRGRKPKNNNG